MELPDIYECPSTGTQEIEIPLHVMQECKFTESCVGNELTISTPKLATTHSILTIMEHLSHQLKGRFGDGHQKKRIIKLQAMIERIQAYEGHNDY